MILDLNNITKGFNGSKVIEGLSVTLERGMVYALIGPNGAGKTTLLNLIDGQLRPTNGNIVFKNKIINKWPVWRRSKYGILRTWQNGRVFKNLTVLDNLMVAGRNPGENLIKSIFCARQVIKYEKSIRKKATEQLDLFDLAEKKNNLGSELSLGEKGLIDFIRLQMHDSIAEGDHLILLDEPFSGIHQSKFPFISQCIREFANKGNTALVVEHNTSITFPLCDRVLLMNNGNIEMNATSTDIIKNDKFRDIYFC